MKSSASLLSVALLSGVASAHTIFQELWVNGVDQGVLTGIRVPDYDGVSLVLPMLYSSVLIEIYAA